MPIEHTVPDAHAVLVVAVLQAPQLLMSFCRLLHVPEQLV
jgi:hypothetical protein